MDLRNRLQLIAITDRSASGRHVVDVVRQALAAGATCIQLREKVLPPSEVYPLAKKLRAVTQEHGALLIVNDRLDLALAIGADGVHVGPEDLPVEAVRRVTGPEFVVGYSTSVPSEAREAEGLGVDYVGCGPVFTTSSKVDAGVAIGFEGLRSVADAVTIPVVGIGGIRPEHAYPIYETGAAGCAVIGALAGADNVEKTVRAFLAPWDRT